MEDQKLEKLKKAGSAWRCQMNNQFACASVLRELCEQGSRMRIRARNYSATGILVPEDGRVSKDNFLAQLLHADLRHRFKILVEIKNEIAGVTMIGMMGRERAMYLPLMAEVKKMRCMKGAYTSSDMIAIVKKKDLLQRNEQSASNKAL
jgi:hypothetical protein